MEQMTYLLFPKIGLMIESTPKGHWSVERDNACIFIDIFKKKKVLVAKLCPTLCDPMDCSPLSGDYIARLLSVRVILQARILEWVAISSSRGSF